MVKMDNEIHFWIEEINNGYTIEYRYKNGYKTIFCNDKEEIMKRLEELIQSFVSKIEI